MAPQQCEPVDHLVDDEQLVFGEDVGRANEARFHDVVGKHGTRRHPVPEGLRLGEPSAQISPAVLVHHQLPVPKAVAHCGAPVDRPCIAVVQQDVLPRRGGAVEQRLGHVKPTDERLHQLHCARRLATLKAPANTAQRGLPVGHVHQAVHNRRIPLLTQARRQPNEGRHARAALEGRVLGAAQRVVAGALPGLAAVVAAEHDDGVLLDAQPLESGVHVAYRVVNRLHEATVPSAHGGVQVRAAAQLVLRALQG
mmetsp:Transcript_8034/g.33813  ORF Transcript_8034/g.33813 Transcript_8034/m.33813 type:complete len:253 (-) Transcript_8034:723-1481(-)